MSEQNLPVLVRADPDVLKLIEHAQKAERFDIIARLFREMKVLDDDIARLRRSRSKMATINTVALEAQISEIKLLISTLVG